MTTPTLDRREYSDRKIQCRPTQDRTHRVDRLCGFIEAQLNRCVTYQRTCPFPISSEDGEDGTEINLNATVSILAEIPEDLHESLKTYLEGHPDWDQDRVFAAALSLFLLQNENSETPEAAQNYRRAARVYLETLFQYSA